MRAGKKYILTFMHSTARSFSRKATPECSFSHQAVTQFFDPTVICNERARFFGIRARPRDQTQSVSSMRPLSPHSMMKKKKLRERKIKSDDLKTKNDHSYFIFLAFLSLSGGMGVPRGAVEFFSKKKACTSLRMTDSG